jgi:hypothetical protein
MTVMRQWVLAHCRMTSISVTRTPGQSDMLLVISDILPLMQGLLITLRLCARSMTRTPPATGKETVGPERVT